MYENFFVLHNSYFMPASISKPLNLKTAITQQHKNGKTEIKHTRIHLTGFDYVRIMMSLEFKQSVR